MNCRIFPAAWVALAACAILSGMSGVCSADSVHPLSVALNVKNRVEASLKAHPITAGVPIPVSSRLLDVQTLQLVDEQYQTLPAQFRVLSRWNATKETQDAPIKWVLVDFQADFAPMQTRRFRLKSGGTGDAERTGRIRVDSQPDALIVDTGAMQVVLPRDSFPLFGQVTLNSAPQALEVIVPNEMSGVYLTDHDTGITYGTSNSPPDEISIERDGPMHSIILIRGRHEDPDSGEKLLHYSARLHFYAGKSRMKLDYTLENHGRGISLDGSPDMYVDIRELLLRTKLNLGETQLLEFEHVTVPVDADSHYQCLQIHEVMDPTDENQNFFCLNKQDGTVFGGEGKRGMGYADLGDGQAGVFVVLRHFWQNFPKSIEAASGELSIGVFPNTGEPHHFQGSYYKNHEILFEFYQGDRSFSSQGMAGAFQTPPLATFSGDWAVRSGAFGYLAPDGWTTMDPRLNVALADYEMLQRVKYDESVCNYGTIIFPPSSLITRRETRKGYITLAGVTYSRVGWYGWEDFGCMPWLYNFSALHYGWPYGMTLQFVRTGEAGFWDLADEMTRHSVDIDLLHSEQDSLGPGFWHYERDAHDHFPAGDQAGRPSHTWGRGYLWQYYLTGEERYLESARLVGRAMQNYWFGSVRVNSPGTIELRQQGWAIEILSELYRATGETRYLDHTVDLFHRTIASHEAEAGGQGYVHYYTGSNRLNDFREAQLYMEALVVEPLINLYLDSGDEEVAEFLVRMADWLKDEVYFGGILNATGTRYIPWQTPYFWDFENSTYGTTILYNWMFANVFAFAYQYTGSPEYLDWARKVFIDGVIYWDYYQGPATRDDRDVLFTGVRERAKIWLSIQQQTSKQHGWINRYPQYYLYTEYLLSRGMLSSTGIEDAVWSSQH